MFLTQEWREKEKGKGRKGNFVVGLLTFHVYRVTYYLITKAFNELLDDDDDDDDDGDDDDDDDDDDVDTDNNDDDDDDGAVRFLVFSDTRHNSRKFAGRAGLFCRGR